MTSPSLIKNEICATLFNNFGDKWHWAICIPSNENDAQKLHIKEASSDCWLFESISDHLRTSATCAAVIKIGTLNSGTTIELIEELLKAIPLTMPAADAGKEPRFTCRVWFKEAVRVLHANNNLTCHNVDQLEEECKTIAKQNDRSQPGSKGFIYGKVDRSE